MIRKIKVTIMKINFDNSEFKTTYSFESPRSIIRALSDAFSRQHCDTKGALLHAAVSTEGRCLYCGKPMYALVGGNPVFSDTIHYDHIYPASKFNLFEVGNVAIACGTCNLAKSDRFPMDYYDVRAAEGVSLFEYDRNKFERFLNEFSKPYREKWPKHYAAGSRVIEDDDEFKRLLTKLLYEGVDISSMSTKYNHENSINKGIWVRVVKKAYETYSPTTAKDVEGRIGYTDSMFEDTFGHGTLLQDISIKELSGFINKLLLSKYESKNEIQKFRMLIRMLVEILNEDIMEGQLTNFYENVPTYSKLNNQK